MTPERLAVGLETGSRWVFASAVDWPGWCRRGKGEEAALEALLTTAGRYRAVVGTLPGDVEPEIVGRVDGDATTDFGAPGAVGPWDHEPLDEAGLDRQVAILQACWAAFDAAATGDGPLTTGPRGGGRQRDAMVGHVRDAERTYARKVGIAVGPRTPWEEQRSGIAGGLRAGATGAWPVRYALRRIAWHVVDHAWEIEDRSGPGSSSTRPSRDPAGPPIADDVQDHHDLA